MNLYKRLRTCHFDTLQDCKSLAPPTSRDNVDGTIEAGKTHRKNRIAVPPNYTTVAAKWAVQAAGYCLQAQKDTTSGNIWSHSMTDVRASLVPREVPANCYHIQQERARCREKKVFEFR